jgi:hypothetical protein
MSDEELRLYALLLAERFEGPKANTAELLAAASEILEFLRGRQTTAH